MERASRALAGTRYADAERLCRRALEQAHRRRDYAGMARALMPLQEARRQRRQLAADADRRALVSARERGRGRDGFILVQPPMTGMDARRWRERALDARLAVFVLCREPMTRSGEWPVVAVGSPVGRRFPLVVRVRRPAPEGVRRVESSPTLDPGGVVPPLEWFESAGEALGDAAIAAVPGAMHPAWRVDDLMAALDAFPDHEKLHQRLEEACREALIAPPPPARRPRAVGNATCF